MQRLSSNLTLILKIFIPTAWVSFFGLFGIVIFVIDNADEPFLTSTPFRIGYVIGFLVFAAFLYFTLLQLKRVEAADGDLYVTNYFKTVKFPVENIEKLSSIKLGRFELVKLNLLKKGVFGNKVRFLAKRSNFQTFISQYPHLRG